MKKIFYLTLITIALSFNALHGNPFKTFIHRSWGSHEGLPQNSIYSIAQDSQGFIWIGTAEGLVKFDGTGFELFDRYTNKNFKSNVILAIHESSDKCLYAGLRNGGVVRKCNEDFKHFSVEDGLTSNTVTTIAENAGVVYFGTFGGKISVFKDGVMSAFSKNSLIPDSFIHAMTFSNNGILYIATDDGLYSINDDKIKRYGLESGLPELKIRALFFDSDGDLWVGTSDSGLAVLKNGKFEVFTQKNGLASDRIFAINEDSSGNIWVGTVGGGLSLYDRKSFYNFSKDNGLSSNVVRSLFKDRENNIWAGTFGGGINLFRTGLFSSISSNDGLSDNVIFALLESSDGRIFAGTYGKGLNIIDDSGNVRILNSTNGLSGDIPAAIFEDSSGRIWVGSYGTGLDIIEKDGSISSYGIKDGLDMGTIVTIFEAPDGTIYLGGYNKPLAFYSDGRFTTFTKEGILKNRTIWAIDMDKDGSILLGTDGSGLVKMKDNEFSVVDSTKGLSDDKVTSIYRDRSDILWIGTYDNGINIIRPDGTISHIKKENGLFDNTVYAIVEDNENNIWMSSNRGLFYITRADALDVADKKTTRISSKVFSWKDGMPSNECNGGFQKAGIKTTDGRLMFPTIKGIAVMDPSLKKGALFMPDPVVTDIFVDGSKKAVADKYELDPDSSKIRVEFTAPYFSLPEKISFRHRLISFDREWVMSGKNRIAEYMNLEPGEYVFELAVSDIDGKWNQKTEKITFIKEPAFHQSIWFRLLVLLAVFLAVYFPVTRKLKKMEIQNEELSDLVNESEEEIKQITEELDSKYASSSLDEEDLEIYKNTLEEFMQKEKPYLDNELSIRKLAADLDMQPHHLSQVINSKFDNNFYTYVNNYRINEVIELMKDPKRKHHTILAIAYDSGFKSKSSFNTIFKKVTGKTPSEFRDELDGKV